MLKIDKSQEPEYLTQAKGLVKNPKSSDAWQDSAIKSIRTQLREEILNHQSGMCAYCEKKIALDKSHIDHFRMRDRFPEQTLAFSNLWVSCGSDKDKQKHCAHHKDAQKLTKDDFLALPEFIALDLSRVEFTETGRLIAKDPKDTIMTRLIDDLLNLNEKSLVADRKRILQQKDHFSGFSNEEVFGFLHCHRSLIQQYFVT
jgi:uncharacterized protein (TIGR02646 family)